MKKHILEIDKSPLTSPRLWIWHLTHITGPQNWTLDSNQHRTNFLRFNEYCVPLKICLSRRYLALVIVGWLPTILSHLRLDWFSELLIYKLALQPWIFSFIILQQKSGSKIPKLSWRHLSVFKELFFNNLV